MQNRRVVVGGAVVLASIVSYGFVKMLAAGRATGVPHAAIEPVTSVAGVAALAPLASAGTFDVIDTIGVAPDATMMLAAGVMLYGLAAGLRRHGCE